MVVGKDLKPISGSERALVKNAKSIGTPDPNEVVEVTVVLRSKGAGTQISSVREISAQPLKERRYLSREEFATANALNPDDLAKIEEFAHEHGLTIVKVSPESSSISLSGLTSVRHLAPSSQCTIAQLASTEAVLVRSRCLPIWPQSSLASLG